VLAFRYGTVLLEVLEGVLGCAGELHDAFSVEVQHLMAVTQVRRREQVYTNVYACRVSKLVCAS
jgi:hypothetical protein